ncbi:MAG: alpha/beta hydrolase [Variovorax sp.]
MQIKANEINIEVEDTGGDGPAVLLIMGLAMQLTGWPEPFVQGLADAGYRVIRFDNRDVGLSQGFDAAPRHNILWQSVRQRLGLPVRSPYTLQDMAGDALGVLQALGVARAHIVGASMGGMIAQRVAAQAPERALSLVSLMSSSGAQGLPGPRGDVALKLLRPPPASTEVARVAYSVELVRLIGSPAFRESTEQIAARITESVRRAYRPAGVLRQMLAIGADQSRAEQLARVTCPTLVLHGEADVLVPIGCGRDTARRIREARFIAVPGMGHDLPPQVVDILLQHMLPFLGEVDARSRADSDSDSIPESTASVAA